MLRSFNWKLWLGLFISALFSYLALRQVDLSKLWHVLQSTKPIPLLFVFLITFLQHIIRAWRWQILLEPIKKTTFGHRLSSILIGFGANCILPARLGEFIRAHYLGNSESISSSSTFGTIVVERLFDAYTLLLVLLIGLMGTIFPPEWRSISASLRGMGLLLLIFYSLLIFILIGFKYKAGPFLNFVDRILFFIPARLRLRLIDIIRKFSLGLVLFKNPYSWIQVVFYSWLLWFSHLYQIQLVEQSLGLTLPFIASFMILAMASFGVMIPSAPGFIGTFHLSVQYGFLFYGIAKEEALSAAIVWHATFFIPTVLLGLIAFLLLHIPLGKLSENLSLS
ncbi:MAG: lysylphosphatidylglycerol synthase transmembrane domain-containing protein, partial [Pseudomonadota bacterium]